MDSSGNENHGTLEGGAEWNDSNAPVGAGTSVEPNDKTSDHLGRNQAGVTKRHPRPLESGINLNMGLTSLLSMSRPVFCLLITRLKRACF